MKQQSYFTESKFRSFCMALAFVGMYLVALSPVPARRGVGFAFVVGFKMCMASYFCIIHVVQRDPASDLSPRQNPHSLIDMAAAVLSH